MKTTSKIVVIVFLVLLNFGSIWSQSNKISLVDGEILKTGERIYSSSSKFYLVLKEDGNFCVNKSENNVMIWGSTSKGSWAEGKSFDLFTIKNGNLIGTNKGVEVWSSKTAFFTKAKLVVDDDGVLNIMDRYGYSVWDNKKNAITASTELLSGGKFSKSNGGSYIYSADYNFILLFKSDGNLCVKKCNTDSLIWSSMISWTNMIPIDTLIFKEGKLTAITDKAVLFSSNTISPGASLVMGNDGIIRILSTTATLIGKERWNNLGDCLKPNEMLNVKWSKNGNYAFVMQADGDLCLYKFENEKIVETLYSSNTVGKGGINCKLQTDGNIVMKNAKNEIIWNSATANNPNSILYVQDDGNVVVFCKVPDAHDLKLTWSTNTSGK